VNYNGLFGESEMECAAKLIVNRIVAKQTWHVFVTYSDMAAEATGFLHLVSGGFLGSGYPIKSRWWPTPSFIERVSERLVLNYPDAKKWPLPDPCMNFEGLSDMARGSGLDD
jgi:hypothetical protein